MFSDLRFAFRLLTKSPGFTCIAVLALALGLSAATTMFTFYNAVLLRPTPYLKDESRLVMLRPYHVKDPDGAMPFSQPDFLDLRRQVKSLEGPFMVMNRTYIIGGQEIPERLAGFSVSAVAFTTLGVQPFIGRNFRPDEEDDGSPPVALISYGLWQRRFAGRHSILNESLVLNGQATTIIGVMPEGFRFPDNSDIWQPFHYEEKGPDNRGNHSFPTFARIKDGYTLEQVQAELKTIGDALAQAYPKTNAETTFRAGILRAETTRESRLQLQLMLGAVVFVLLIACGNVANLLLARAATRSREMAVRSALGADRSRIVRQVLTESVLLGLLGGILGVIFSFWGVDFVIALIPTDYSYNFGRGFTIDRQVLAFAFFAALGSSMLFGLIPALQISRPNLTQELKDGGRSGSAGRQTVKLRSMLVVVQMALALVLLVGAGLMIRSFVHLQTTSPGLDARQVLTFRVGLPPTQYKGEDLLLGFWDRLMTKLQAIPGVESAGAISYLPSTGNSSMSSFAIEGRPEPHSIAAAPFALHRVASEGTFTTLRIPLLRGRLFDANDNLKAPKVAVVDQAFVDKYFPNEDPLGHRLSYDDDDNPKREWFTIVGVIGNVRQIATSRRPEPAIWMPLRQHVDNFANGLIRVKGNPMSYKSAVQAAVLEAQADIPIYYVKTMEQVVSESYWYQRLVGQLFTGFAAVALLLAVIGIYGVMSYTVSQRTQEIGVRMALGAEPGAVVRLVLSQGLRLVVLGLAIGFVGAWFVAQLLSGALYGISPHDPPTFAAVPLLLAVVALAACWIPSRRATRVPPIAALRAD
jgi:putative ABC transport system permease protein